LILKNITSIIVNERMKNNIKYLELLTATVSHEMLTPLNSIMNLSKIIKNSHLDSKLNKAKLSSKE